MAFIPPLGNTSPEVLLDNTRRLDKLVNGPAETVDDRGGEPLPTWRGITADIENVLASLDTSNSTFPDEPSGIAGTTNGQYFRTPQGTGSPVAFRYFVNADGVALRRLHGCWVLSGFSIFSTFLSPCSVPVVLPGLTLYFPIHRGSMSGGSTQPAH